MTEITHREKYQPAHKLDVRQARCVWCGNRTEDINRLCSTICPGPNVLVDQRIGMAVTKTGLKP